METIKVNMSPNPLDVQTIHASQNDGEARQWEFELHNNGELIDTSDVKEQLVFKSYKGGTEQILPENGSTPTTSPFLGDIRYPQGLLTSQEFTYRQSPTEKDGLAKITDIKGNTLVWNQLVQNGNFADDSVWSHIRGTLTVQNNVGTYEVTEVGTSNSTNRIAQNVPVKAGHKYAFIGSIMGSKDGMRIIVSKETTAQYFVPSTNLPSANTWYKIFGVGTATTDGAVISIRYTNVYTIGEVGDKLYFKNLMFFDLTQLGIDSLTDAEVEQWFTSLFSLPYYAYNQGSLLSFNGNGIKTVGFNQWDEEWEVGGLNASTGALWNTTDRIRSKNFIDIEPSASYYIHYPTSGFSVNYCFYDGDKNFISSGTNVNVIITTPTNARYMKFATYTQYGTTYKNDICINISSSRNGEYEPYKEETLSLPISQYFPNGMKSAGNVYDELTESKAITRIGAVDLGSLAWTKESRQNRFNSSVLTDAKSFPSDSIANGICAKYIMVSSNDTYLGNDGLSIDSGGRVNIHDTAYTSLSASDFKTAMSGVYLYYELATPTETSFTTASLVTENAEIPLSNEDGTLIGKCTEQLSENPGFIDAKIKLSDADGECYSNKIQLHVERSPQ